MWVFHAWRQPLPAFNPNDGPLPADNGFSFLAGGMAMLVPLVGLSAGLAGTGTAFIERAGIRSRWLLAWMTAVIAGIAVDIALVFVFAIWAPFGMGPGHANWTLLAFPAAFLLIGAGMAAMITAGRREAERQALATPAQAGHNV